MKKAVLLSVFVLLSFCIFAETSANNLFDFSAYKVTPPPATAYNIAVSYWDGTGITGIIQSKDVSDNLRTNKTLSNAFRITITSNLKANIDVIIRLTPFINQSNSEDILPVTYTFGSTASTTEGTDIVRVGNTSYYYRYTPQMTLYNGASVSGSSITSVAVEETRDVTLRMNPAQTVGRRRSNNNSWSNATMPSTTSNTLPGIGTNAVSATGNFTLNISNDVYDSMSANVDYVATVRLTITTV